MMLSLILLLYTHHRKFKNAEKEKLLFMAEYLLINDLKISKDKL